jgi:hypothetical protein
MSWLVIFFIVFFLVNMVRFAMSYFGKKFTGVPDVASVAEEAAESVVSKGHIGATLMDVIGTKLFPDIPNVYDGIKTREQLDELVEKLTMALDGVPPHVSGGEAGEHVESVVEEILEKTDTVTSTASA